MERLQEQLGYRYKFIGDSNSRQNKFGLFNHFKNSLTSGIDNRKF